MHIIQSVLLLSSVWTQTYGFDNVLREFIIDFKITFPFAYLTIFSCSDNTSGSIEKFSNQLSRATIMHQFIDLNVNDIHLINTHFKTFHQHYFVVDFSCSNAANFLIKANRSKLFTAPQKWLLFTQSNNESLFTGERSWNEHQMEIQMNLTLSSFPIFPDSEVYICLMFRREFIAILSVYHISIHRELIIEPLGYWNSSDKLVVADMIPISRRRQNLKKENLKTCLVMINPDTLNHLSDFADKKIDGVTKANYFWIQYLIERMNATMSLTWENTWGYQDQNGTWNGMIGLLDRGQIDFGGTATFLIPQRLGVIDYIQLYTPVCSRFIFKKPPLSYVKNLFTLPFNRLVWYAISFSTCVICGFLYLVLKWEWKHTKNEQLIFQHNCQLNNDPNLSDNLLILIGALFQQGSSYEPRNISSKIVILMLLILSLSLYAAYTANIVALLQSTTSSINTVQDLIRSGLKIGIYDVVYNRYYFQAMQDPMRKNFYKNFVENKTSVWMPLDEGIEKVKKGLFAFHADATASYVLMQETYEEEEKCGLHEIDYLNLLYPMLVLPLDSPYREIFRVGALWIKETGLQQRINRRLFTQKPTCVGQTSFVSVGTIDCYAAFLIILYGIFIAIGFLLMEIIHFRCSRYFFNNQVEHVNTSIVGIKMAIIEEMSTHK